MHSKTLVKSSKFEWFLEVKLEPIQSNRCVKTSLTSGHWSDLRTIKLSLVCFRDIFFGSQNCTQRFNSADWFFILARHSYNCTISPLEADRGRGYGITKCTVSTERRRHLCSHRTPIVQLCTALELAPHIGSRNFVWSWSYSDHCARKKASSVLQRSRSTERLRNSLCRLACNVLATSSAIPNRCIKYNSGTVSSLGRKLFVTAIQLTSTM